MPWPPDWEVEEGDTVSSPGVGECWVPHASLSLACLLSTRLSSPSTQTRSADRQELAQQRG